VKAGLSDAAQTSSLQSDYSWSFRTIAPSIGTFTLNNGVQNPQKGYQGVLLDAYFTVEFHQPMDRISTENFLRLKKVNGEPLSLITNWNEEMTQVIITPTQRLDLDSEYLLSISKEALAEDGGALSAGLEWNFYTLPYPAVSYTQPANGSSQKSFASDFTIKFASPMNFESVKQRIEVFPLPKDEIQWWYNDWDWSVHAYDLQPSTSYRIRLLPGMQDIYGNEIKSEKIIQFRTAAYSPQVYLQMPYMPALIRSSNSVRDFFVAYRNIKNVDFYLYKIDVQKFVSFQTGQISQWEYKPAESDLVWHFQDRNPGGLNQLYLQKVQLSSDLQPGFYFLGINSPETPTTSPFVDSRLVIIANTNLTFKSTSTEALVWLTDLENGKPIENVSLTVFDNQFQAIGTGVTDNKGLSYINIPPPSDPYAIRYVVSKDDKFFAFSFSQWGSGSSYYDYGSWGMYYAPPNQPKAYIYTDRPIYRPGQPVYFKGIVRMDDDLKYSVPDKKEIKVTFRSYDEVVAEQTLSINDFGSFSGELLLDKEAALGSYSISASFSGSEEVIGDVSFNVAEYRKPEFWLDIKSSAEEVLVGSKFDVSLQTGYYAGGALGGANVNWTLTSNPYTFSGPVDLSGYSFTDQEEDVNFYQIPEPPASEVIAEGQGVLDANGKLTLTLPAELKDKKKDQSLIFEATVTDISGNTVSDRSQIIVHRSLVYPGVSAETYVGKIGESETFEIIVVDWEGKPVPGQFVDATIYDRRWHSVQEQDAQGNIHWTSSVEEIPVATFHELKTDENGKSQIEFVPANGGTFKARVVTVDSQGNQSFTSAYMWVSGESFIPWRQTDDRSFPLIADRASYLPGDTAEILIASPYQGDTYALVTVERGHIRKYEVILLKNNSTVYKLPVLQDMAPNVYVSVVVMKGIDETNPRPDFKIGVVELKVNRREQAINVQVVPDREKAQPGEKVTYRIVTRDSQDKPVNAEVSFGLSDLATLSLVGPNSAPIMDYFYSERALNVWTSIPIVLSLEDYNATVTEELAQGQGMGAGGGKGGGELGVIEIREEFPDTAYWNATVETGDSGEAKVTITLPDNLTTWRADVRAVSKNTLVGQSTQDIISSKPLLLRPQTPRFFVAGDEAQIGTAVQNNTNENLDVNVSLTAEGVTITGENSQMVNVPSKGQAYVTWKVKVASGIERVDMVFKATGGQYTDATRPTGASLTGQGIPVYHYEARESVGTSGVMTEGGTRIESISLPSTVDYSGGSLDIELSPSLAAGLTSSLNYLQQYPYDCIEQTVSKFLPNVATRQALKAAGIADLTLEANLSEQVNSALQRLYNWQNADGGWGWWYRQKSDINTSAYVIWGMVEAKKAGYSVNEGVLNKGVIYLQGQIFPVSILRQKYALNRQVFILYVLNKAGKPDASMAGLLFDKRLDMSIYARALLAEVIASTNRDDTRVNTLLSDLNNNAVTSATGTHWEESEEDYLNWNTNTRTTAIVLSVVSKLDSENPLIANAVRWLMSNRVNGHWKSTQENAWTIMALTDWMNASEEMTPDYRYAVTLNDQVIGQALATTQTRDKNLQLKVDVSDMIKERVNQLGLIKTEGQGRLYYTVNLNLSLAVEDIKALNNGMIVSRNYYSLDNLQKPIQNAKMGDMLLARLTVVAPNDLHYVVIDDPLPAGLEAIDESLLTSVQEGIPTDLGWEDIQRKGWGWWYFNHVELRDEKVVLSVDYLPAGTYIYTYLVRAVTPGIFKTIPPVGEEFYFPEVYGRGEGSIFKIIP
jgi:hypothetical protein